MNKKGFTLVELLAVIIILAVILTIILPSVSRTLKKSKNTIYDIQINDILNSTYDYSLKNLKLLPESGKTYITLNELKKHGYIENNIKDPKTNKNFENDLVISIENVGSKYKNTLDNSLLNGNYLYKVEEKNEDVTKNPVISFEGYETTPILISIDLGSTYNELEYSAKTSEEKDITNKVVKNITFNENNIDKINTYEVGIYYIDYCVVDNDGYSICEEVNVVVKDEEKPNLTIPENVTISTEKTSYDLEVGLKCTDNSNNCKIEIEEDIVYGTVGKYVVTYKATDPSGNTTIKKRVITIE